MSLDRLRPFRCGLVLATTSLAVALAVAAPQGRAQAQSPPSGPAEAAPALAARLQTRYDTIKDFTADFTQTYQGGVLRRKTTESGTLLVKKPGRMRWEDKTPEEKLFVADGRKLYAWVPADRQVTVSALPSGDAPATPVLFLLGRGQLVRDFTPSLPGPVAGAPADSIALALVPKTPVPEYDRLTLVVDRATLGLRMLIALDGQGGTSTFVFTQLRENVGLADSKFAFTIPRERMLSRRSETCLRRVVAATGAALLIASILAGCASTSSLKAGREAEKVEDFDRAVVEYEKALRAKPSDLTARLSLQRAKLRASAYHDQQARRLAGTGKLEEALIELQIAAELNPASGDIDHRLRELRSQLRAKLAIRTDGKTRLQALVEGAADLQPSGLELPRDVTLADSLVFRNASVRDILTAIGHFADINVVFDPQFRDQTVTVDLRKTSLEDALQAVTGSTRNFYKISAAKTITIIPDTPAKRREYEDEIIRTFFLSNADVKETLDLLRLVVDNRRLSPVAGVNAIAIKDTPDKIAAAGRVIRAIDKARAEVVIDVELLEVDRAKLHEFGLQYASPGSPGVSGSLDANRPNLTLSDLGALTTSDVFVTGLPGLYYRLIKTDGSSRTLANPHLRTADGLPSSARFGEDVPVPSVTFAPIASGGVNQQPITAFTYRTIGVNIEITPRLHHDDDISLRLKLEVSNLSGVGYQNLPTFGTRYIETTIRLRDGETNMLAGLIRDEERTTLEGIAGLSDLPIIGRLFGHTKRETKQTDIVLMLTPRIVRVLDLEVDDLRPFRVGRDSSGGVYELPLPTQQPQPAAPPQDDDAAPGGIFRPGSTPAGPPGQITPPTNQPTTRPPAMPPTTPPTTRPPQ